MKKIEEKISEGERILEADFGLIDSSGELYTQFNTNILQLLAKVRKVVKVETCSTPGNKHSQISFTNTFNVAQGKCG